MEEIVAVRTLAVVVRCLIRRARSASLVRIAPPPPVRDDLRLPLKLSTLISTVAADRLVVHARTERLGGVLDDGEPVSLRNVLQGPHACRVTEDMHRHHSGGWAGRWRD